VAFGTNGPRGGYILEFLGQRGSFGFDENYFETVFREGKAVNGWELTSQLLATVDWTQMVGGLIVAVLLVLVASEYRRRVISA
jgi:ABC-2 type transport system permease protein